MGDLLKKIISAAMRGFALVALVLVAGSYAVETGVTPLELDPIDSYGYEMGEAEHESHSQAAGAAMSTQKLAREATAAVKAEEAEDAKLASQKVTAIEAAQDRMEQKVHREDKAAAQESMIEKAATTTAAATKIARQEEIEMSKAENVVKKTAAADSITDAKMAAETAQVKHEQAKEAQEQKAMNKANSVMEQKDAKIAKITASEMNDTKMMSRKDAKIQSLQHENHGLAVLAANEKQAIGDEKIQHQTDVRDVVNAPL